MSFTLIIALVALISWISLLLLTPVTSGSIHLLARARHDSLGTVVGAAEE